MRLCSVIPTETRASYQAQVEAGAAALASLGVSGAMFGYAPELDPAPIRGAFEREGVRIAELCLPYNLCAEAPEARERMAEQVVRAMLFADALGCANVQACSGGFSQTLWIGAHPLNFTERGYQSVLAVCRSIADKAEQRHVRAALCIEPLILNVICSAERLLRLVDEVGSPHVQAHMDAANLMTLETIFDSGRHLAAWFAALGQRIRSVHAKDSIIEDRLTLHIDERAPGKGQLDFAAYVREVARLPVETPFVVEHLATRDEIAEAVGYIRRVAAAEGITLL